ncbi:MAG: carbohydrate kinase family protein [Melioribacteraceae bacterium]|nr:carbohydrate kinase family protein [Melioribacteraceae bacterium]
MSNNEKKYDVIVVGELNVDLILNKIDSFPEMGKEKLAQKMDLVLGSSSAIFASNLSSLGAKISFLGKVGDDSFGKLCVASLENKGVDTSNIIIDKKLKTGATIVLNYNNDRAMVTHPGSMEHLRTDEITEDKLKEAKHLHLSSPFLQPGLKNNLVNIFTKAKNLGLTTSLDTQWDPNEKWDLDLEELLPFVDVFLPNVQELILLTSEESIEAALNKIEKYANTVVVKMSEKGSLSMTNGERREVKAFLNTIVVDAIGAGDSFNAGFISKYIQGASIVECQTFGNLTGALNTTSTGGTSAFENIEKIKRVAEEKFKYQINGL